MKDKTTQSFLPKVPFVTQETARGLKRKTIAYLLSVKEGRRRFFYFLKQPKLFLRLSRAIFSRHKQYLQKDHLFFFGCSSIDDFLSLISDDALVVVGLSYCQKPRACPRGRFNDACSFNEKNEVCRACPIAKFRAISDKVLIIPTFLYIAEYLCEVVRDNPGKKVFFLITACELSLRMFGDYTSVLGLRGIGVRLIGRICNTFNAFKLAEKGIKPGVTLVESETERAILEIVEKLNMKKNHPNNVV